MADYLLSLIPTPNSDRSINRLRAVYTDLLQHIDLDNDCLGLRSRIDDEDVKCQRDSSRFSFRRSVLPSKDINFNNDRGSLAPDIEFTEDTRKNHSKIREESRDASDTEHLFINQTPDFGVSNSKVDLATAFRMLAATKSPDKEGENYGAVAIREDSSVCGMQRAKALESRVVELIRQIGEIVAFAGNDGLAAHGGKKKDNSLPVRTDPVFEYFCEKCMLSLFVDIAKEVRRGKNDPHTLATVSKVPSSLSVRGVVWSASVKAQVYQTVSLLISDTCNKSVTYYLLSNNYVNELINCIFPLQQWTEPALAKMLPAYVDLLKNLTLQLAEDLHLFSFLTIANSIPAEYDNGDEHSTTHIEFPLFSAALETAISVYAQSDSKIYATCLAIIVNLMQISHTPIQTWICHSNTSQRILADHLCQRLLDRYYRMTNLTRGPVVNCARHTSIARQLASLKDEMGMVHEIFWCGVRGMDIRLCESLLQKTAFVLLKNLLQVPPARPFLVVGLIDADVIPEQEASAQVATVFFSYMFSNLVYVPFQRMLSVVLFHQNSPSIWSMSKSVFQSAESLGAYVLMPALSDIVDKEKSVDAHPNPFRQEMFKTLEGDYGEWRVTAAACLLQSVLDVDAMDTEAVVVSGLFSIDESNSSLDHSIAKFLRRPHKPSATTLQALECTGYLGLMIIYRSLMHTIQDDKKAESLGFLSSKTTVWDALKCARDNFCRQAMEFQDVTGVSDVFLDLTEAVINSRYITCSNELGSARFTYPLSRYGYFENMIDAEFLVRQNRGMSANDIDTARFYIKMGIHFRALCKVVDRMVFEIENNEIKPASSDTTGKDKRIDFFDVADPLIQTIGGLSGKTKIGATLDLTGRMAFRFQSAVNPVRTSLIPAMSTASFSTNEMDASDSRCSLTLVLDPTDLFVVKPMVSKMEENRGTILFGVSLRNVIGAAVDQAWLHIAIRDPDAIIDQTLIKNGNMALEFESAGICLIVKQYLDRSREVLRQDLLNKMSDLLQIV